MNNLVGVANQSENRFTFPTIPTFPAFPGFYTTLPCLIAVRGGIIVQGGHII